MIATDFARSLRLAKALGAAGVDLDLTDVPTALLRANRRRSAAASAPSQAAIRDAEVHA